MSASEWPLYQCFIDETLTSMSLNTSYWHMSAASNVDNSREEAALVYNDDQNGTLTNETSSFIFSDYFWLKTTLLTWDFIGVLINGLGIDMLWHGVEINHAVYFVILQDMSIAFGSSVITEALNWLFWTNDLSWFRAHCFLAFVPFTFHNWAWASVAHLRCLNITDNDQWLELDQEEVRRRTTWMTWFAFLFNIIAIAPFAFSFEDFVNFDTAYNAVSILIFSVMSVSFALAFNYYIRIYRFARKEAAELEAALAAQAAAVAAIQQNSIANSASQNGDAVSNVNTIAGVNNIFDDSEDEVLLDPSESPVAKQESAVISALKTMSFFAFALLICAVIMSNYGEEPWKYAILSTLLSMMRYPGIMISCIYNFGPIRNTVSIYVENLPDHVLDFFGPFLDRVSGIFGKKSSASTDDQRNIVEAAHEDLERATSPAITKDSKPNILGKRDSAVSPSNSNNSSMDELPAVQC